MFYKTKEGELYPVKMILVLINKIKNKIINERYLVILSLLISLSLSFLISVILHSNSNSPYSIKDLIKSTAIISIFILIISCVLVMNRKQIINDFVAKEILPFVKNILNEKSSWLAVVLFLLALGILILIIIPNGITYNRPQFSYGVKIEPVENFDSVLCIKSISNNYGDILRYNETVKNLNITGNWKHNVDGCSLFLESGEKGIISFQNIGSVQDKLNIVLLNSAKTGVLKVTSNPGKIKFIDLKLEKNYLYNTNYKLGSVLTRNLTDCGVTIGVLSCVIFLILVFSNQIPKMNRKILNQRFVADKLQSLKSFITKSWEAFDRENMAILALLALYILGVIFTIKVINPMSFGPSHFKDEVTYWNASRSIFNGQFSTKQYHYPPLYPISILPAFYLSKPIEVYTSIKLLNALFLASAIFPGYFLLRKFVKRNIALLVSALLLLNPVHLVMPGRILSENLFYPLLLWAILFAFTNVFPLNNKNRIIQEILLGILIGLLFLSRYIALVLIPALLLVWWLKPFENEKPPFYISLKKIGHLFIIILPITLMISFWIMTGLREGMRVMDMLGFFIAESPNPEQLSLGRLVMWTIFYGSYTVLLASPFIFMLLSSISTFELIKWQQEFNRWIISITAIISAFMIACIRHSWRGSYNFPIPQKLQGRYILYFGPLFLITAFASIYKPHEEIKREKIFLYSSSLIIIAYAFLYIGLIYLDDPLSISASSPDDIFISAIGALFILFPLANTLLNLFLINKKKIYLTTMVLFLLGFYIYGDSKIIQDMSNSSLQISNSQIYHLLFSNEKLLNEVSRSENPSITIFYPSNATNIYEWTQTLKFYGFDNIQMIEDPLLDKNPNLIFQAQYKQMIINLHSLDEDEYLNSNNVKYAYRHAYYDYQVVMEK